MLVPVNIKIRWFFIYAGFGLALTFIVTALLTQFASREIKSQVSERLKDAAFHLANTIERGLFERQRDMRQTVYLVSQLQESNRLTQIKGLLETLQTNVPEYAWIGFTDPNGQVLVSTGGLLEGMDVSHRPWFSGAKSGEYISDVHKALLLERLLEPQSKQPLRFVDIALPVVDPNGHFQGVLSSHLNWQWAERLRATALESMQNLHDVDVAVFNSEQQIILGATTEVANEHSAGKVASLIQQLPATGAELVTWLDGSQQFVGVARVSAFRNYQGPEWTIVVRQPVQTAYEPLYELRANAMWVGLGVALVFAAIGWVSADRISRPFLNINLRLEREIELRTAELQATNAQLQQLATTDSLTGLANRRAFFAAAQQRQAIAKRSKFELTLLMLDIDFFKKINDNFGHAFGDSVLVNFADVLREITREVDVVARTGGEEFCVILADTTIHGAHQWFTRLQQCLQDHTWQNNGEVASWQVTCSAGATIWSASESAEAAMDRADKALYQAKQQGRNRVISV